MSNGDSLNAYSLLWARRLRDMSSRFLSRGKPLKANGVPRLAGRNKCSRRNSRNSRNKISSNSRRGAVRSKQTSEGAISRVFWCRLWKRPQ